MSDYNKGFELSTKLQAEIDKRDWLITQLKRDIQNLTARLDAANALILKMPAPTLDHLPPHIREARARR